MTYNVFSGTLNPTHFTSDSTDILTGQLLLGFLRPPSGRPLCFTPVVSSFFFVWPPYGIGQAIIFLSCGLFYLLLSIFFFSSPIRSCRRLDVYHTSTHGVALTRFLKKNKVSVSVRMQVWNLLDAARWKNRMQKSPKIRHVRTIAQLCRAASSQLRHVSTMEKLVQQQYLLVIVFHYSFLVIHEAD